jgi:hypothetical protein
MTKKFRINIECDVEIDICGLWPGGDNPENPTAKDVDKLIEMCGGPVNIIRDWDLEDYVDLYIYPVEERFVECPECAAKPGSPTLCDGCLTRRADFYKKQIGSQTEGY